MKRRTWLLGAAGGAAVTAAALPFARSTLEPRDLSKPHTFILNVDAAAPGVPVNRMLLGQNVQWVDGGDDMLDPQGNPQPVMMRKLKELRPTSLRFPGGAQSDTYRWAYGMGPLDKRRDNLHFNANRMQKSVMGTQEFLELCEAASAVPLITVNTVTGTAAEAAAWLRQTNKTGLVSRVTGQRLPSVPFWEIGNEPYLKEGTESQRIEPAVYIARANLYIKALREVDPTIRIGIPLRTATIGGMPATPYPRFAHDVLTGIRERFDFISNHNAYLPYLYDAVPDDASIYWGTMAAAATAEQNIRETRELARSLRPRENLPQAITEYNAMFSLGRGASDEYISSPLGALYVADVLRMFATQEDLLLAQYWSLSGNWKFGAIASEGYERPGYIALQLMEECLRGERLAFTLACGRFDSPRVGASAAAGGLGLVTCLVTRAGNTLRVLLINKDIDRVATGRLWMQGAPVSSARVTHMVADEPLRAPDGPGAARRVERDVRVGDDGGSVALSLPAASLSLLTMQMNPGP